MHSIHLRQAAHSDMAELIRLLQDLFSIEADFQCNPDLQQHGLEMLLDSKHANILVAAKDGAVIGMVTGQLVISTAEGGYSLLIEDLVIAKDHRGKGLGSWLLQKIGTWGKLHGASRIQLLADKDNKSALDFYNAIGWKNTSLICLRKFTSDSTL